MNKWLVVAIVILSFFIISLIFIPKNIFNDILYKAEHLILGIQERKIEKKEGESKAIEKSVKIYEEQSEVKTKQIVEVISKRENIKPAKNLQDLKRGFAELGYPPK